MRGTVTSLDSGHNSANGEGTKYIPENELEPFTNPEIEYKLCQSELKSTNWSSNFDAINNLRRIVKFHRKD